MKASDEDLAWLYPGVPVEDIMRRWVTMGPEMVVVTRGPWGAYALLKNNRDMLHLDQMRVEVADTVGAGDSFMAGLISALLDAGFLGTPEARQRLSELDWTAVQPALHRAVARRAGVPVVQDLEEWLAHGILLEAGAAPLGPPAAAEPERRGRGPARARAALFLL